MIGKHGRCEAGHMIANRQGTRRQLLYRKARAQFALSIDKAEPPLEALFPTAEAAGTDQ